MDKQPVTLPPSTQRGFLDPSAAVLLISDDTNDRDALAGILKHSNWKLFHAPTIEEAAAFLRERAVPVAIVSSSDPGVFMERLFGPVKSRPHQPKVIVTVRISDMNQWVRYVEAGAFDVLQKPFESAEVFQVIGFAWVQWKRDHERATTLEQAVRAAG